MIGCCIGKMHSTKNIAHTKYLIMVLTRVSIDDHLGIQATTYIKATIELHSQLRRREAASLRRGRGGNVGTSWRGRLVPGSGGTETLCRDNLSGELGVFDDLCRFDVEVDLLTLTGLESSEMVREPSDRGGKMEGDKQASECKLVRSPADQQ